MRRLAQRALSPAMIVAVIALIAALSGSAVALRGINRVKSNDIARGAVHTSDLHRGAVRAGKVAKDAIKAWHIRHDAVRSSEIAKGAVGSSEIADGAVGNAATGLVKVFKGGAVPAAANEASAARVELGTVGPFRFYGKCFDDGAGNIVERTYIELTGGTATVGTEDADNFQGNATGYLTPSTPESSRELENDASAAADSFSAVSADEEFQASASDGTEITGLAAGTGAKQGNPPAGNGPFLTGDSCIVGTIAVFGS